MGKQILQKFTIFEVKCQLAEMEKQFGKKQVAEMLGESRAAEIDREFKKSIAERLEPYWKDIQAYEHGGFWAQLRVKIKYIFRERRAECNVPKYVLQAIVDDMLPDIRAFFESEEGKREFEEWRKKKASKKEKDLQTKHYGEEKECQKAQKKK